MVSWFRFFDVRWSAYEDSLKPKGASTAAGISDRFKKVKTAQNMGEAFSEWMEEASKCPGLLMVVRGRKNRDGKGMVDIVHHLKWLREEGDDVLLGLSSLSASAKMIGIPSSICLTV